MTDTLSALDATFLELEQQDEGALMHIGGVMVFDPLPGGGTPIVEEIEVGIASRLHTLPRYSKRLSTPRTGGLAWPHWCEQEGFDVRDHITRAVVPAPGGDAELCEWAADFYSHRLDRTRPLWEMVLVEGLERGRWALAHKTHHCLVDGVGSVDVAQLMLDRDPAGTQEVELDDSPPARPAQWRSAMRDWVTPEPVAQATHAGRQLVDAAIHATLHPRDALARSRSLAELIVRDEVIGAPQTSINVPIGATRRLCLVRTSLDELRGVSRTFGGSLNDVILAASTSGLRHLLQERGEPLPSRGMRAMVPMNLRAASEHLALGNRVSSLFVDLPVAEADPLGRYLGIVATTARLKSSNAAVGATTVLDIASLAPPVVHAMVARSLYATRLFNVTITNVPGPAQPLYALGAQMREVIPIVPLAAEHALGVAIFSYCGNLVFGLSADRISTPDLHVLAEGIEDGMRQLVALAGSPDSKTPGAERSPAPGRATAGHGAGPAV